ncbi:MAG: hypothetical protein JXA73_02490 [Acidobacteria bacterium]|nr:hypothetical protein [Acidobacteriota bacterium]
MNRLEDDLRMALKREEPPEGFLERVLAETRAEKQRTWIRIFAQPGLKWALAGAMCLVLLVGGIEYKRAQDEQARGEAAKAQLILALRITADKLQLAQTRLQQHSVESVD